MAYKSSSLLIATFALSSVPPFKVVVGAFKITLHALISAKTSSGIALFLAMRFSIVKPSIVRSSTLPLAISSFKMKFKIRSLSFEIIGPIPSPEQIPIIILSSA